MTRLDSITDDKSIGRFVDKSFDISDRIFEILTRKGLSQRQFADILGKNESEVSKWLSGTHNFTIKTITHLEVILEEVIMAVISDNLDNISFEYIDKNPTAELVDCENCLDNLNVPYLKTERVNKFVEYSLSESL
ncbi:helix-turn-helix domain-containing protein [Dyadobacter arcticus]|uniref:Transcriptional regulator with XRE-family HTH domain n=1 Tax=Dyadobacter arcticus TaxID=1078754 RepID=A0ABX0UIW7_9BACT|nr:helix-turn-helix transcriptional regulator [Dyadobacter arcticus]NIJ52453.1 transcriptional regulator with XRE-family HTH domain [Dyadobacter arcticus]